MSSKKSLTSMALACALLAGASAVHADEPEGGCAEKGGYQLASTVEDPRYEALDREIGNNDGFVCVKFLPGDPEGRPGTRSIIDNRVQSGP